MARINNLTNFLTDIATAIKSKTKRNTNITPSNFDTEILSIASDLGSKNISISSNGTSTYQASNDNLDGYSSVAITTNVQPTLQSKTVSPTTSEQTVSADNNYDGLSQVTVSAIQTETKTVNPSTSNVTVTPSSNKYLSGVTVNAVDNTIDNNIVASNIKKDVSILGVTGTYDNSSNLGTKTITSNGTYNASSDNVDGYSSVTTNVQPTLQSKTISPTTSSQTISADNNYDGLSQVTINAVTNSIDSNITAGNIKKDVSILGVTGTYDNSSNLGTKTITENGTYNASSDSLDGYSSVTVNVPSSGSLPTITDARYLCAYNRSSLYDELLAMCSGITSVAYMFYYANNVANLDLTKLNVFNITNMTHMFSNAKFTSLNFSGFNTSNVTDMRYMFYNTTKLTNLNLSSFDTSKVKSMSWMFRYASKLVILDISNFDFSGVTSYDSIFYNCGSSNSTPTTVYVKDATAQQWILNLSSSDRPSNWSTSNVVIKGS